jgi:predicted lipid carrier protein YhbT
MAKAKRAKYAKYVTMRSLLGRKKTDVGESFGRLAELLKDSPDTGSVQFRIVVKDQPRYWNLRLDAQGCTVHLDRVDKPDLEIITQAETWLQIAGGKLSPLIAFARRKMRIRGDEKLGKRLLRQLASSEGRTDIC